MNRAERTNADAVSRTQCLRRPRSAVCIMRSAALLAMVALVSGCTVLVPQEETPPATWLPLPTVGPYASTTPEVTPQPPTMTSSPELTPDTATPMAPTRPTVAVPSPAAQPATPTTVARSPTPTASATRARPTPSATPASVLVEGAEGTIHALPAGGEYVALSDPAGEFGVAGALPPVQEELARYRDSAMALRLWGILEYRADYHGGAQLLVTRLELSDGP